jgi:hypothetical protein
VLAVATNLTLVPTVLPFEGLDTVTPAKADMAAKKTTRIAVGIRACFFILTSFLRLGFFGLGPVKLYSSEGYAGLAGITLNRSEPPTRPEASLGT